MAWCSKRDSFTDTSTWEVRKVVHVPEQHNIKMNKESRGKTPGIIIIIIIIIIQVYGQLHAPAVLSQGKQPPVTFG
jgi:hypothetical protein